MIRFTMVLASLTILSLSQGVAQTPTQAPQGSPQRPLSLDGVVGLLDQSVTAQRVVMLARQRCVDFQSVAAAETVLTSHGMDAAALRDLRSACRAATPGAIPRRQGPPVGWLRLHPAYAALTSAAVPGLPWLLSSEGHEVGAAMFLATLGAAWLTLDAAVDRNAAQRAAADTPSNDTRLTMRAAEDRFQARLLAAGTIYGLQVLITTLRWATLPDGALVAPAVVAVPGGGIGLGLRIQVPEMGRAR